MKLRRRREEIRMELTPLIDVVFLLLVFFVFALVLMVRADALDLQLPKVGTGRPAERSATLRVTLAEDGGVLVDGAAVQAADAGDAVRQALDASPGLAVVLSADARAPAGSLIELADALVAAGVTEFSILGSPAVGPWDGTSNGGVENSGEPRPARANPAGAGGE